MTLNPKLFALALVVFSLILASPGFRCLSHFSKLLMVICNGLDSDPHKGLRL